MRTSEIVVLFLGITPAVSVQAQPVSTVMGETATSPAQFFPALIVGIILAGAIQLVVTTLSSAAGLSPARSINPRRRADRSDLDSTVIAPIRMFNSAFGLWSLIGGVVSLFLAVMFAVALFSPGQVFPAVVLGLTIWGTYCLIDLVSSGKSFSMTGSLLAIVISNLRSVHENTISAFAESEESKIIDKAQKMVADVRDRMQGDVDIQDQLQQYVAKLEPRLDPKQISKELPALFSDVETEAIIEYGSLMDRDALIASLHTRDGFGKEQSETLADAVEKSFSLIKQDAVAQKEESTQITDEAAKMAGMASRDARDFRKRIEHYLKTAQKTDLEPEHIRQDMERLLNEPKTNLRLLKVRSDQLDKSTVSAVLSQRHDLSETEAKRLIEQITRVAQQLRSKTRSELHSARISALARLRDYLGALGRHELRFEGIMHDLRGIFSISDNNPDIVMRHLQIIDNSAISSMVRARRDLVPSDADDIIDRIVTVRDEVMSRALEMKEEIKRRIEESRHNITLRSEYQHRTMTAVTWWTFGSIIASGIASVAGALAGIVILG